MKASVQKTHFTTPNEIERKWYIVNAEGQTLGRLASRIAQVLRGKHKPEYVPNLDVGDYVVVINCEKIVVTGRRLDQKLYYRHTGYPGGLKDTTLREMMSKFPDRPLKMAVKGMLPKGPLGRQMLTKLRIYVGSEHPHEPQQPDVLEL